MALSDDFKASEYLIEYYIQSAVALRSYEDDDDRGALRKATTVICEALKRLSDDASFWTAIERLDGAVANNEQSIKEILDQLDLFLSQEDRILCNYQFPESVRKRLILDLGHSVQSWRNNPDPEILRSLRAGISDAASTMCAIGKSAGENAKDGKLLGIGLRTREGLGVLGGVVTIIVNGLSSVAAPLALASIVGGTASSLGFLAWLKRKKG